MDAATLGQPDRVVDVEDWVEGVEQLKEEDMDSDPADTLTTLASREAASDILPVDKSQTFTRQAIEDAHSAIK